SDATLAFNSVPVSSKDMNTPGSLNCVAPRARNSAANSVLPQPAPPHTSVGRPRGNPPPVISSRPWMPVGHLGKDTTREVDLGRFFFISDDKLLLETWLPCDAP